MEKKYLQAIFSARHILKNLRELMAKDLSAQERLDKIVEMVSLQLNTDVCSCYVWRPGDVLELWASKGLDPKAVHETYLRVGEGLIGEIAAQRKSLVFEDAWAHPSFVHKPETREEAFKSLAGVPIIRGNSLLGVLAVQTKKVQSFQPESIEVLETVAMVVAEMLFTAQLKSPDRKIVSQSTHKRLEGVRLIEGLALGKAVIHKRVTRASGLLAKDPKGETEKLKLALKSIEKELNRILANPRLNAEQSAIFETYLMFIHDKGWISKIIKAIESGLTADAAVQKVEQEITQRMQLLTDPYIKEKIHDFRDLANRLVRHLKTPAGKVEKAPKLPKNTILVAESLGPAELLDYDISHIKGILLEEGSQTMHVVIVARSLNIPIVSGVKDVLNLVNPLDVVALDATQGRVYLNPSDEVLDEFSRRLQEDKKRQAKYAQMRDFPAVTLDNMSVSLNLNAGLMNDFFGPKNASFDGIGLYRTELPFMSATQLPDTRTQTEIYKRALLQVLGKPVVFRTLDIGSDKVLPYFQHTTEENPAMGWRSIRMTLDRRVLLKGQIRAFIRATAGRELALMFPMIASVDEFLEAKRTFEQELLSEKSKTGLVPVRVKVGTMLEVPSLVFQLEELLKHVDFISIGTNDLAQFLFASDRGNPLIWNRYDTLNPALLRTLKYVSDLCRAKKVPCSVCGEMAGKPLEAMALVGLGITSLSMNPASLGAVKAMVRTLNQQQLQEYLQTQLQRAVPSLRERLTAWARDHQVFI